MRDYHIHTILSTGMFTVNEIVEFASKNGFDAIGICDNYRTKRVRSIQDVDTYFSTFRENYDIKVFKSLEIDFSVYSDINNIFDENLNKLDYILIENVEDKRYNGNPFWMLLGFLDKINVPVGLAHNNIGRNFSDKNMEDFIDVLESRQIFIEINTSDYYTLFGEYFFELSSEFFEKISKRNVPVSIGSDTREKLEQMLTVKKAYQFIEKMKLEENLKIFEERLKN